MLSKVLCVVPLIIASFFSFEANAQTSKFKATFLEAQKTNQEVAVTLKNGNVFSGTVESVNDESAGIKTADGLFNFRYDRIKSVKIINPNDPTSGWYKNPAANKLFITQSGKMLEKGSGYYQNTYILFSNFSFGLTKNVSMTGGFSTVPGLGARNQLYLIGAKAGTVLGDFSIAANATYYSAFDSEDDVATMFGSLTYSKKKLDLTGGVGWGFTNEATSDPLFIFGAQFRVSQRFAFLAESFVLPAVAEAEPIAIIGGRIIGPKTAIDLGFFASETVDVLLPFVSFAIKL